MSKEEEQKKQTARDLETEFWQALQETQRIQDEMVHELDGTTSAEKKAVHKARKPDSTGSGGAVPSRDLQAVLPSTGTSEHPREYFHDSAAFQALKKRYGIRNRFWRKNYKRLKPGLSRLYEEAIISRYRPLTQAILVAREQPDPIFRKHIYRMRFVELLQETRRIGPLYLEPLQQCQLPRKESNQKSEGPLILNQDGSLDLELREQVLAYFDAGMELLNEGLSEEALKEKLKGLISRFEEPPQGAPINKMMNSTWMRVLSQLVPGFPLIGVILTEMDSGNGVDWKTLGNRLLGRAARDGAHIGLKRILQYLRAPGAFLPVSFLLEQGMDRSELLGYLSLRVERKKRQLRQMAHPKKHL
ncbi:MAG: hypothetical protein KDK23_13255 [Leptospiraceae bacterium]|nr:hypothetical protein [Leptospiraceae bacterium]